MSYEDIALAARILAGKAHRTPVLTSRTVDRRTGARVFFKCENLQRGGAFKFRGAYNALHRLASDEKRRGVVAYSSGNHAQAVALAGQLLGVPATIVMPDDAPQVKIDATRGYGAEVVLYDRVRDDREAIATELARTRGVDTDPSVQSPAHHCGSRHGGERTPGRGRAARSAARALRRRRPAVRLRGRGAPPVPRRARDRRGTRGGRRCGALVPQRHDSDGRQSRYDRGRRSHVCAGRSTFSLIMQHVADMLAVEDAELLRTMWYLWERLKIVVEPTGALGAAALLEEKVSARGQRVGIILSGGNADIRSLCALI